MAHARVRQSMNVSIAPEQTTFATDRFRSGRYKDASEVARAALRLVQHAVAHRRELQSRTNANAALPGR